MLPRQVEVVIVGAGPTGLTLAVALQEGGRDVVVLDKGVAGANTSRAAVVHARTLEVLEPFDVTRRLRAEGVVVPHFTVRDQNKVLAEIDFASLPSDYPYTLMIPQSRTEEILTQRLLELGGHVYRECEVTAVTQDDSGVEVTFHSGAEDTRIRAQYVTGADGMHSAIRTSGGISFSGASYPQSFLLADVQMSWPLARDEVQLFLAPAGLVVVAPLPHDRFRIVATMDEAPENPSGEVVQSLLDDRGTGGAQITEVVWASRFHVHHRVANRYVAGRVVLAGDAAHVHSPAGGQGMNTGIQDAVELARQLVAALDGTPHKLALAEYERLRRPVALEVVKLTDRATRMATLRRRPARVTRNAALRTAARIPAVNRRIALRIAELDQPGHRARLGSGRRRNLMHTRLP